MEVFDDNFDDLVNDISLDRVQNWLEPCAKKRRIEQIPFSRITVLDSNVQNQSQEKSVVI